MRNGGRSRPAPRPAPNNNYAQPHKRGPAPGPLRSAPSAPPPGPREPPGGARGPPRMPSPAQNRPAHPAPQAPTSVTSYNTNQGRGKSWVRCLWFVDDLRYGHRPVSISDPLASAAT